MARLEIVQAFLEKDEGKLEGLLEKLDSDNALFLYTKALLGFLRIKKGVEHYNHARSQVVQALQKAAPDPEIYVVVIAMSAFFQVVESEYVQAQRAIEGFVVPFRKRSHQGDLCLWLLGIEWYVQIHVSDDMTAKKKCIHEAFQWIKEKGSPDWLLWKARTIETVLISPHLKDAQGLLEELEPFRDVYPWQGVGPYEFLLAWHYYFTGNYTQGLHLLESYPQDRMQGNDSLFFRLKIQLMVKLDRAKEASLLLDDMENHLMESVPASLVCRERLPRIDFFNLKATVELRQKNFEESRRFIQRAMDEATMHGNHPHTHITRWILLNLELSCGHARAARLLLNLLSPGESTRHMEWARLYLLENNKVMAATHFKKQLESSTPESVKDRLSYAYELTPQNLMDLFVSYLKLETKPPVMPESPKAAEGISMMELVGETPAIVKIRKNIGSFSKTRQVILISGETGTGKEVVARLIHQNSPWRAQPFLAINCGSMADSLIESELFGHAKGAYTGATSERTGLLMAAGKGTVFLDEITSMSSRVQTALLRVLENGEIRPVGSNRTLTIQARVVAATNESLSLAVQEKRFRQDLFYRLTQLQISLPPLRERVDDIPVLARHFIGKIYGPLGMVMDDEFVRALQKHSWPGNVRELKNLMERVLLMAGEGNRLSADMLAEILDRSDDVLAAGPVISDKNESRLDPQGYYYRQARRNRLRELFKQHARLTRADVVRILNCSPNTATHDLREMEKEGYIRRVHTSAHLRTSYFTKV